jgi:hypothetical protein
VTRVLNTWDFLMKNVTFYRILERSCTAEFSGFFFYKEISRNLKKENLY